jgi:hypothetical protein
MVEDVDLGPEGWVIVDGAGCKVEHHVSVWSVVGLRRVAVAAEPTCRLCSTAIMCYLLKDNICC